VNYEVKFEHETLGALAVLSRGNDPAFGNAIFLVGWSEDWLWLLGGNQTNQVSVAAYVRNRLVALRWSADIGEIVSGAATHRGGTAFQTALRHVLVFEGGCGDDSHDPGGPINKGITLRTPAAWRKVKLDAANQNQMIEALKCITDQEVAAIYHNYYWRPLKCWELPSPLAIFHFDASINHGVFGATRMIQQAVGANVDGEIRPQTKRKTSELPV